MAILTANLIRGHTDTIVLSLLQEKDMYGYEIVKEIYKRSDNQYELKEITLYSSLKRLLNDGYIKTYWGDETRGGRRKYYNITKAGIELYKEKKLNWEYAKNIIERLI